MKLFQIILLTLTVTSSVSTYTLKIDSQENDNWQTINSLEKEYKIIGTLKSCNATTLLKLVESLSDNDISNPNIVKGLIDAILFQSTNDQKFTKRLLSRQSVYKGLEKLTSHEQPLFCLRHITKLAYDHVKEYLDKRPRSLLILTKQMSEKDIIVINNLLTTETFVTYPEDIAAHCLNFSQNKLAAISKKGNIFIWNINPNQQSILSQYFETKISSAKRLTFAKDGLHLLISNTDTFDKESKIWKIGGYFNFPPFIYIALTLLKNNLESGITLPRFVLHHRTKKGHLEIDSRVYQTPWLIRYVDNINEKFKKNTPPYPRKILLTKSSISKITAELVNDEVKTTEL